MSANSSTLINPNPILQRYYASLESRLGYRLFLGGTRHYGYYHTANSSPLPIDKALRNMENSLFKALDCPSGSRVLDAGCGYGHVALYMARAGNYQIECIDVVERHVQRANQIIRSEGMQNQIQARHGDYHHLENYKNGEFDGIYTMETLVHSTDPLTVLKEFHRLLKPGGKLAMNEYDHIDLTKVAKWQADAMKKVNQYAAMPANSSFDYDVLQALAEEAGFEDVRLTDLSKNIVPMLWLFYLFAIIPYLIFRFLGIEHLFVNTVAGAEAYRGRNYWRYIQVTGRKSTKS